MNWEHVEESGRDLIRLNTRHLPAGTVQTREELQSRWSAFRSELQLGTFRIKFTSVPGLASWAVTLMLRDNYATAGSMQGPAEKL
jgi:hypothetical protein